MIYLLRHGETVWNTSEFQGLKDSPLTKYGIEQAAQMGILLSRVITGRKGQFKGYVSPLGRRLLRGVYLGLSKREMLELPVPQSAFYRLQDGKSELLDGAQPNFLDKR
jgi:broad specificity phosphatase PhoE